MNPIIKETQDYTLTVGTEISSSQPYPLKAYHITNKDHGVIEIQTFLLPQALKHMEELQAALDAQIDSSN